MARQPRPPLPFPKQAAFVDVSAGQFVSVSAGGLVRGEGNAIVRIEGDAAGVFSVAGVEVLALTSDPDVRGLAWETVSTQVGAGPIAFSEGNGLVATIGFAAPANPASDQFSCRAVAHADRPDGAPLLDIPVHASLSRGSVRLQSLDSPEAHPGQVANFRFRLTSSLRRESAGGILTCDAPAPSPFSSDTQPQFPIVPPGGSIEVELPILCAAGTAAGLYPLIVRFRKVDNSEEYAAVSMTVRVTNARIVTVTKSLDDNVTLEHGSSTLCELRISVSGGPTALTIAPDPPPPGITLENAARTVAVDGSTFMGFTIVVDQPKPGAALINLNWSVPPDDLHPAGAGVIAVSMNIVPVTVRLVPTDPTIRVGQVEASNISFEASSTGGFTLTARLHDFSTVTGDNFAFGFAFNLTDDSSHAYIATGELGSSATRPSETFHVGQMGFDPWIAQNWRRAFAAGGLFKLHVSSDVEQAISDIGDDFKNIGRAIAGLFRARDCPRNPSNGEPQCPDPATIEVPI